MLELTKNNHFKFGYKAPGWSIQLFKTTKAINDEWQVNYGPMTNTNLGTYREECAKAALYIANEHTSMPKWILFSGGLDSEVVLQAFIDAGADFKVATCRFAGGENAHDIKYVQEAEEKYGFKTEYFDLDVWKFFEEDGQADMYADMTKCLWPEMTTTMWLMDEIISQYGIPILGSGECYLTKMIPADYKPGYSQYEKTSWTLNEKESISAWYKLLIERNANGVAGFGQYTPEQMYSFLISDKTQQLVNDKIPGKLTSISVKHDIYNQWYDFAPRLKYTGFENIEGLIKPRRDAWHESHGFYNSVARRPVQDVLYELV